MPTFDRLSAHWRALPQHPRARLGELEGRSVGLCGLVQTASSVWLFTAAFLDLFPAMKRPMLGLSLMRNRAGGCINAIALRLPVIQRGLSGTKPGAACGGWRTYPGCGACTHSTSTASDRSIGGWLGHYGQRPTPN